MLGGQECGLPQNLPREKKVSSILPLYEVQGIPLCRCLKVASIFNQRFINYFQIALTITVTKHGHYYNYDQAKAMTNDCEVKY